MQLYELGKLVGIGSFGQVFLCKHKGENKFYVVKKLRIMELQQKQRENIENELKLLQKLRHPDIVSYKDSFTDTDGNLCIVMLYCEAGDMHSKIRSTKEKGENFKETQILDWIAQTALAIHYLHIQKILHRDLKSQNIFMKVDKRIRLGDFGIAKVLDNAQDLTSTCIGTPYYMAPQIFKYKAYSYKCDIWSFGVIIYQMCNLRLPFEAQNYSALALKVIKGSYPSISPTFSKQLRDLIGSMLSLKPNKRPSIVDVINKPFIKKRVEKYVNDMLNRTGQYFQEDEDVYLGSLRDQAMELRVPIHSNTEEENVLRKYPSSKDIEKRWTRNILSRRGLQEEKESAVTEFKKEYYEKRKSLLERDTISLQKNAGSRRRDDVTHSTNFQSSSSKALGCDSREDHKADSQLKKKKSTCEREFKSRTIEDRFQANTVLGHTQTSYGKNLHDRVQSIKQQQEKEKQKILQQENIKRFKMQEDYSMNDELPDDDSPDQSSIDEEIIHEEEDEDLHDFSSSSYGNQTNARNSTAKKKQAQEEEAPENYNRSYYKLFDQTRVLKHKCESGIGTNKYIRAYNAVNSGCSKPAILEILGKEFIGYWHLLDQILFYDRILKTLSKRE